MRVAGLEVALLAEYVALAGRNTLAGQQARGGDLRWHGEEAATRARARDGSPRG